MRELLRFLIDNPILLVILLAWVAGAIGNAAKSAKQAREREARRAAPPEQPRRTEPRAEPKRQAPARGPQRSPEEVAAEMRRILGMDLETVSMEEQRPPAPVRPKRREVVEPEPPPVPMVPTTQKRHLAVHVDPHVGEGIQHRRSPQSGRVAASTLGTLGGRAQVRQHGRSASRLVNLGDLKRAFVASEILGAPLALRGPNELRGV